MISFRQKTLGHCTHCSECNKVQGQFCGDCLYMRYIVWSFALLVLFLQKIYEFFYYDFIFSCTCIHCYLHILPFFGTDMWSVYVRPMMIQIGFAQYVLGFAIAICVVMPPTGTLYKKVTLQLFLCCLILLLLFLVFFCWMGAKLNFVDFPDISTLIQIWCTLPHPNLPRSDKTRG